MEPRPPGSVSHQGGEMLLRRRAAPQILVRRGRAGGARPASAPGSGIPARRAVASQAWLSARCPARSTPLAGLGKGLRLHALLLRQRREPRREPTQFLSHNGFPGCGATTQGHPRPASSSARMARMGGSGIEEQPLVEQELAEVALPERLAGQAWIRSSWGAYGPAGLAPRAGGRAPSQRPPACSAMRRSGSWLRREQGCAIAPATEGS